MIISKSTCLVDKIVNTWNVESLTKDKHRFEKLMGDLSITEEDNRLQVCTKGTIDLLYEYNLEQYRIIKIKKWAGFYPNVILLYAKHKDFFYEDKTRIYYLNAVTGKLLGVEDLDRISMYGSEIPRYYDFDGVVVKQQIKEDNNREETFSLEITVLYKDKELLNKIYTKLHDNSISLTDGILNIELCKENDSDCNSIDVQRLIAQYNK